MDTTAIAVAAVTGAVGLIAGIVGTAYKSRKALESTYDIDLRKARIDVYKKLWTELQVLAKYSPPPFKRETVEQLSVAMRRWYFEQGGIFLSKRARNAYFDLQEALIQTLECLDDPAPLRELLRKRGSRLRTTMAEDIATRVAPQLGSKRAKLRDKRAANVDIPDEQRAGKTAAKIKRELQALNRTRN
jgi:hypothetical protein